MTTSIEWTGETWNPTRGCTLASPGCKNCYAMRFAHRFSGKGKPYHRLTMLTKHGPHWTGKVIMADDDVVHAPLHWRKPRTIFVNSMSDPFHSELTDQEIARIFAVMAATPQHTFQVLTKRADRMASWVLSAAELVESEGAKLAEAMGWCHAHEGEHWPLPNVWLGVSVEDQKRADERIPALLRTPAAVRFLSCEPLLEQIDIGAYLVPPEPTLGGMGGGSALEDQMRAVWRQTYGDRTGVDWVIVGGESGAGARPFRLEWARWLLGQCRAARVPFFFKQAGARPEAFHLDMGSEGGGDMSGFYPLELNDRKGGDLDELPADLRVREVPR